MRIKSGVWYWLAMACFVVGLLYGIGVEGTAQTLGTVSDGAFVTAMVLILLAIFFMRLGFAAEAREKQPRKIHQQPRNTVKSGRKAG
jgi:ABC-type transporter Mla maintaining outer membrane lipid asymmetry permease subunit MlaE